MRFGLLDNEPKTLGEVAEKMGLSRERVRQIEERAVSEMRKAARKAGLLEYMPVDHRTRKLHTGMSVKQKTNILGEVVDRSPLARLLSRRAAAQEAARRAGKAPKANAKKSVSKKASPSSAKRGKKGKKK